MNENRDNRLTDSDIPAGLWVSWSRTEILGLFFLVLTGNFFGQFAAFSTFGGLAIPVLGGAVLGVFLPLLAVARLRKLQLVRDFALDLPPWTILGATGLLAVAGLVPTSILAELSLRLTPAHPESVAFMNDHLPEGPLELALAFLALVVVAPLAEEIIFRGLLHRLASSVWGPLAGTAVSSLVFGILHGEAWILFGLIGVGVVLAFVWEATRSLTACWLCHAIHNGISLVLMVRQGPRDMVPQPWQLSTFIWAAVSLLVMVAVGKFLWEARMAAQTREDDGHTL
jgi:membrane protease YdiL (CAAX protease family)|nr:type II CAAX endopeptidase family protein [Candidatus Krumholzibacteria bacterium]